MKYLQNVILKVSYCGWMLAAACGPIDAASDATIEGRITTADGHSGALTLAGDTAVSAGSRVRAHAMGTDGALVMLGEASVDAEARYRISVPPNATRIVIRAYDDAEATVGSTIVATSGRAGGTVQASPIDSETSLESEVFVAIAARGHDVTQIDTVDLRARLGQALAVVVRSKAREGRDVRADIDALADAVVLAQATEIEAYAAAGLSLTQEVIFAAELAADLELSAALHDGRTRSEELHSDFVSELQRVATDLGLEMSDWAAAGRSSGLAYRHSIRAQLSADASSQVIVEEALAHAAAMEAHTNTLAVDAILRAGGASDQTIEEASAASAQLEASIAGAADLTAVARAFTGFSAALSSQTSLRSSVLGSVLEIDTAHEDAVRGNIQASLDAASSLDAAVRAALDGAVGAIGNVDTEGTASSVVGAYESFDASVHGAATSLTPLLGGANATLAAELLIVSHSSFRLGL